MKRAGAIQLRSSVALAAYAYSLRIVHAHFIAPLFGYLKLTYVAPDELTFAAYVLLAALAAATLPAQTRRPSNVAVWLLYLIVGVPIITAPSYLGQFGASTVWHLAILTASGFIVMGAVLRLAPPQMKFRRPDSLRPLLIICGVMSLLCYGGLVVAAGGIRLRLVGFYSIYDVRSDYREFISTSTVPFIGYLIRWQGNVINVVAIAIGLEYRRWGLLAAGIIGEFVLYSLTGYRQVVLAPLVVGGIYWLLRDAPRRRNIAISASRAMVVVVWASVLLDRWFKSGVYVSTFVRRLALAPALLTGAYYDYFQTHEFLLLRESLFRFESSGRSSVPTPYVIGERLFGDRTVSANVNFLGDGYANGGPAGVLIAAAVAAFILLLFDGLVADRSSQRVVSALVALPMVSLANSALSTTFVTHGLGLALLCAFLVPLRRVPPARMTSPPSDSRHTPRLRLEHVAGT